MEMIDKTEKLIEMLEKMQDLDTIEIKRLANRINIFEIEYTRELKNAILRKIHIIEKNNLKGKYSFDEIKKELIDEIKCIANNYCIIIEEEKTN